MANPKIGIYKASDTIQPYLVELFKAMASSFELLTSFEQVIEAASGSYPLDIIILPLLTEDGAVGPEICRQIKSDSRCTAALKVGFVHKNQPVSVREFYEAGADLVISPPYNHELILMQLTAFNEAKSRLSVNAGVREDSKALAQPAVQALNCCREGIVIFNSSEKPVFFNRATQVLLKLENPCRSEEDAALAAEYLRPLFLRPPGAERRDNGLPEVLKVKVKRTDGTSFDAMARSFSIISRDGAECGLAVSVTENAEMEHLSRVLLQAQRTRELCLFLAGGALNYIQSSFGLIPLSAMSKLGELLAGNQASCSLNKALMALTEVLDLAIGEETRIEIRTSQDWSVNVQFHDLVRIVGQIMLYAVEQSSDRGRIIVTDSPNPDKKEVYVVVSTDSLSPEPRFKNDTLTSLRGAYFPWGGQSTAEIPYGIDAAQRVAEKYFAAIQFKHAGTSLKVRVNLPLA